MAQVYTPWGYQDIMEKHIQSFDRGAVWAGMGLGKTVGTLTALENSRYSVPTYPALVVAPLRVARRTWAKEASKWEHLKHLRVSQITGHPGARIAAMQKPADIYTTNYENVPWLVDKLKGDWPFRTIIADESRKLSSFRGGFQKHYSTGKVFYAGKGGQRTRALGRVAHASHRFIELTGTPAPNGLMDLWGQSWFLDLGERLGRTFGAFQETYFYQPPRKASEKEKQQFGWQPFDFAQEQIQNALADICVAIDPADWFDLREPIRKVIPVELSAKAWTTYRNMERDYFTAIAQYGVEAPNAGVKGMKCLQIANGACYVGDEEKTWAHVHDAKLDALESVISETSGAPIIVVYQWKHDLERLKKAFPKGRELRTPADEDAFSAGEIPLLFVHPASAGHGIDGFQSACNIIVFFGEWWDLELREQVIARVGPVRQLQAGNDRPVFIYDLVAEGTIDELVLLRHATKASVQDILLEAVKAKGY